MKVIIVADNLGGGSARLGRALIEALAKKIGWHSLIVLGNARLGLNSHDKLKCIKYLELKSDWTPRFLKRHIFVRKYTKDAVILNLTNFPIGTIFLGAQKELCLLHNAYFFTVPPDIRSLGLKFILRDILARRFIFHFLNLFSASLKTEFIVQTPWMKKLVQKSLPAKFKLESAKLHGWPHCKISDDKEISFNQKINIGKNIIWFYPATGEPHKNHALLYKMFAKALKRQPQMKLIVTLPFGQAFSLKLTALSKTLGIDNSIINVGWIQEDQKNYLLKKCSGIVFLSEFESLGLPLLEIRELNKKAIVIKSNASEYILGNGSHIFDLRSKNISQRKKEQERFVKVLSSNPIPDFEYGKNNFTSIDDAYFFDWIGGNS